MSGLCSVFALTEGMRNSSSNSFKTLVTIDARHPETVALLAGPIVLFAITDSQPELTRAQLLAVKKMVPEVWHVETASGVMRMMPFTAIDNQQYLTYLRV